MIKNNLLIVAFLMSFVVSYNNSQVYSQEDKQQAILNTIGIVSHLLNSQRSFYEDEDTTYFIYLNQLNGYKIEKLYYYQFLRGNFTNIEFNIENLNIYISNNIGDLVTISNLNFTFSSSDTLNISNLSIEGAIPEVSYSSDCCNVEIKYTASIMGIPKDFTNKVLIQKQRYNYVLTFKSRQLQEIQLNLD